MLFPCFVHCSVLQAICFKLLGMISFFFGFVSSNFLPVISLAIDMNRVDGNPFESGKEGILEKA